MRKLVTALALTGALAAPVLTTTSAFAAPVRPADFGTQDNGWGNCGSNASDGGAAPGSLREPGTHGRNGCSAPVDGGGGSTGGVDAVLT